MGKRAWRKEVKKLRRKRLRQKVAIEVEKAREEDSDEEENNTSEKYVNLDKDLFLTKEEWLERERLAELKCAMKKALEDKLAISRAEQERKIREEWEERERKEKLEKEEKERVEKARKEKQASQEGVYFPHIGVDRSKDIDEEFNQFLDFLCGDIETPPLPYIMPEGFDTGEEVCLNFSKTGVCRYYDRCKMVHQNPTLSRTILIPNFFSHFLLEEGLRDGHDADVGLEYEHSELYKEFLDFHGDVLPEFRKHGTVIQFKVCCNYEPHLRGNVYIQYENIRSAVEAFRTFNARFYNGKQISLRFVKIDSWKTAICWSFLRRNCIRGKSCNYLHVFRNPTKEFVQADRDWKELPSNAVNHTPKNNGWNESSTPDCSRGRDTLSDRSSKIKSRSNSEQNQLVESDRREKRTTKDPKSTNSKRKRSRSKSPSSSGRHKKKKHRSKQRLSKSPVAIIANSLMQKKSREYIQVQKSPRNETNEVSKTPDNNEAYKKKKKSKKHKHKKKSKKSKHKKNKT